LIEKVLNYGTRSGLVLDIAVPVCGYSKRLIHTDKVGEK